MPLGFIGVQDGFDLKVQAAVDHGQPFTDVFMYGQRERERQRPGFRDEAAARLSACPEKEAAYAELPKEGKLTCEGEKQVSGQGRGEVCPFPAVALISHIHLKNRAENLSRKKIGIDIKNDKN